MAGLREAFRCRALEERAQAEVRAHAARTIHDGSQNVESPTPRLAVRRDGVGWAAVSGKVVFFMPSGSKMPFAMSSPMV